MQRRSIFHENLLLAAPMGLCSVLQRSVQFCTDPGLVFRSWLINPDSHLLAAELLDMTGEIK